MVMLEVLSSLLGRWGAEGAEPMPPEKAEAIRDAFQLLGGVATADVILLYSMIGGMRMMDNEYWRLWSLEEVGAQKPSEHGVLFGAYCISCWEYRLKPISPEHSAVYVDRHDGSSPVIVAQNLEKFIERLLVDAGSVLDPGAVGNAA